MASLTRVLPLLQTDCLLAHPLCTQWLPPLNQLMTSRAFGAYVLLSAACGAAATYLYDDQRNPKLNTLIKVGRRAEQFVCCKLQGS
jgi:hypothetical protein